MIRIMAMPDGTWTVYRGAVAIIIGLSRLQAERYGASIRRESVASTARS